MLRWSVRWRWRIVLVVSAILAAGATWLFAPRPGRRERLFAALWEEQRATDPRPTHTAPPLPGSFGDLLEPHLAGLHESFEEFARLGAAGRDRVARVCGGQAPIARLDPELLNDLALHRPAVQGALRATHAQTARAPPSLQLFASLRPGNQLLEAMHAGRLAALDMLLLLDQGRADEAAQECVDVVALGRDLSFPSVQGRMAGVAVIALSAPACGRALSAASPDSLERLGKELVQIRRATPPFSLVLQRERLFRALALVDPDPRMPETARIAIADLRDQLKTRTELWRKLALRETAFGPLEARSQDYLAAQRLDWPACLERTGEVARRPPGWNPLAAEGDEGLPALLRRHRDGMLMADAIACVAAASLAGARTGQLPRNTAKLCPPPEPRAPCGERSVPLRIATGPQGPRVSVHLSDGTDFSIPFTRRAPPPAHRRKRRR